MFKKSICTTCGYISIPEKITKGSIFIEIILWLPVFIGFIYSSIILLFFILPGIGYSTWRLTTRSNACPKCKNTTMIPIDSPRGKRLYKKIKQKQHLK